MNLLNGVLPALLLALAGAASAQEFSTPDAASSGALLRADTEIHLRLVEPVASNTHKRGDRIKLELVEPVRVDGSIVIPGGAPGEAEVVHAAKGGFGGRAGELILVSRFVLAGGQSVKLQSFSAGSGQDRVNLALGLSFALVGVFVTGKEITLPAGTDVYAKVAADTTLPIASNDSLASAPAPGPAPAAQTPTLPESSKETDNNEASQH